MKCIIYLLFYSFNSKLRSNDRIDKRQAFKMMLWLVTYYEFFANKVHTVTPIFVQFI